MRSNQSQPNQIEESAFPTRKALSQKRHGCDFCDLHIHTTASDGSFTPIKAVDRAKSLGLRVISLCDHDTLSGYLQIAKIYGTDELGIVHVGDIEVIPGIEINTQWENYELHILGYFVDPSNLLLSQMLDRMRTARLKRAEKIIEKLNRLNMPLKMETVFQFAKGDSVGRPHIAQALVFQGYSKSVEAAFDLYLNPGGPCYVPRFHLTPEEAAAAILNANGIPVWAHPQTSNADFLLDNLIEAGLEGIEVYHPRHKPDDQQKYLNLAKEKKLLITGGSDFHNLNEEKASMIGDFGISYEELNLLKDRAIKRRI